MPGAGRGEKLRGYLWGIAAVALCTAFSSLVSRYLHLSQLVMINLLSVVAVSTRFGIGPSLFTAALSALTFDFFFIPPVFAFAPSDLESGVTLVVMIVVAGVISGLGERTRRQHVAARARDLQIETERFRNSMLSAVSHDLRTPLATILGSGTELLMDEARLDAETRRELLASIVAEAGRLDRLVGNLLDVARLDSGAVSLRKHPEPLEEVVEAALEQLHGRYGETLVQTRVPQEIPMVPMDAVLLQRVLVNLLENALSHAAGSSPIEIEAFLRGDEVVIEVKDRGPGITEEEADRLFERFYRGSQRPAHDGGVGLGLTICRTIVDAHGGVISIRNRQEKGAVVEFTLPLSEKGRTT